MKRDKIGDVKFEVMNTIAAAINRVSDDATVKDAKAAVAEACVDIILDDVARLSAKAAKAE